MVGAGEKQRMHRRKTKKGGRHRVRTQGEVKKLKRIVTSESFFPDIVDSYHPGRIIHSYTKCATQMW